MNIFVIVAIIILIILLIVLMKKYKQNGGFITSLSNHISNENMNVDKFADYIYFKYYSKFFKNNLKDYKKEIFDNLKSFTDILFDSNIDYVKNEIDAVENNYHENRQSLRTICGGLAESLSYLTFCNINEEENFKYNEITCYKMFAGSFNTTFICLIKPILTNGSYKHASYYALRIKYRFDDYDTDEDYMRNYAKIIYNADKETLKYFAVSKVPNFSKPSDTRMFLSNVNSDCDIPTRWFLLDYYEQYDSREFDLTKFKTALKVCLDHIHKNGLLYRDWKLSNFLIEEDDDGDWHYVLGDIDFDTNDLEFDLGNIVHTILFNKDNKHMIEDYINIGFDGERDAIKNIIADNIVAYLALKIEEDKHAGRKSSYHKYFIEDNPDDPDDKYASNELAFKINNYIDSEDPEKVINANFI